MVWEWSTYSKSQSKSNSTVVLHPLNVILSKILEELSVDDFTPYSTYTPSKKKDTYKDKTGSDARINVSEKFSSAAENPS